MSEAGGLYSVIPASVLRDNELRPAAKLLYGEINRYANFQGYCWATNKALAENMGCSLNTVSELVNQLKAHDHISVEMIHRNGDAGDIVQRRIFIGQKLADEPQGGIPKNREGSPEKSGDGLPKNREDINRKKNKREKYTPISPAVPQDVKDACLEYVGADMALSEALSGFLISRIRKRNPLQTVRAAHTLFNRIDKLSGGRRERKITLLDNATLHRWDSVYPLKADELASLQSEDDGPRVVEDEGVTFVE